MSCRVYCAQEASIYTRMLSTKGPFLGDQISGATILSQNALSECCCVLLVSLHSKCILLSLSLWLVT